MQMTHVIENCFFYIETSYISWAQDPQISALLKKSVSAWVIISVTPKAKIEVYPPI